MIGDLFEQLGLAPSEGDLIARTPIDGSEIGRVQTASPGEVATAVAAAQAAFIHWRAVPAPRRGELVRLLGEELRTHKEALGALVTLEAGKIAFAWR